MPALVVGKCNSYRPSGLTGLPFHADSIVSLQFGFLAINGYSENVRTFINVRRDPVFLQHDR